MDTLFALPGVHNDHLFDAVHASAGRMRVLHPRHEQTSAYMALGAALATGRPQAYAAVPGPGILNTAAALLTAYGTGAPVLAIAGQVPSDAIDRGWGHLHELHDQLGLLRHMVKWGARIPSAAEAPALVAEAVRRGARAAGPARWRWNAPSTSGAGPGQACPVGPAAAVPPGGRPRRRRRRRPSCWARPSGRSSSPAAARWTPAPNCWRWPSCCRPRW